MSRQRQTDSLEDQLREERRLAAAMRRRRRKRWMIPMLIILLLLLSLFFILYLFSDKSVEPDETVSSADATATIIAAGDVTLTPQMLTNLRSTDGYDFTGCFRQLTRSVAAADLAIVNVEGNFVGAPYDVTDACYPEALLPALRECGFDVIQTANSYSIQNGLSGLVSTKQAIEAVGLQALGTFASREDREQSGGVLIREVNGIRIAMIGLTKGTNGLRLPEGAEYCVNLLFEDYDTNYTKIDRAGILSLIDRAKDEQPDIILCMVHWGSEYTRTISEAQTEIAQFMLENGVDAILGSHSHLVGPIEWGGETTLIGTASQGLVAYSLGDLLSAADRESAHSGCLLSLTLTKKDGVTEISDVQYIPTYSADPSEDYGVTHYAVYDTLDAIALYESSYYDRISDALYAHLLETIEDLKEQTNCDYQIVK